jgi:hypothetical protein
MKNRKTEMSENDGRDILAHRLIEFQKNTTRYLGPKICMSMESLRSSALNAMDREAFGSEPGGRKKTVVCRSWFLAELTTPIAGDSRA